MIECPFGKAEMVLNCNDTKIVGSLKCQVSDSFSVEMTPFSCGFIWNCIARAKIYRFTFNHIGCVELKLIDTW